MRRILVWLIRGYKLLLSPFLGQNCRFHPGCANYAMEAIELHGSLRGGWYALRRVLRCHPLNPGGWDPVPGSKMAKENDTAPGDAEDATAGNHYQHAPQ